MEGRSFRVPYLVGALAAPAVIVPILAVYRATLVWAGGGNPHLLRIPAATKIIVALYVSGSVLWILLRRRLSRDALLNLAAVAFVAGAIVTLFSFGVRSVGEALLVVSTGSLVMSLTDDVWATGIVLRPPSHSTLIRWVLTLEAPALLVVGLAARDYLQGNNTAATDFGTAWFLYLTYVFGYLGWSAIRTRSAPLALFGACFFAFWGFFLGLFLASLGPISLIAPVAGVGGVVACIPYLWDSSQDGDTAVTRRDAAH